MNTKSIFRILFLLGILAGSFSSKAQNQILYEDFESPSFPPQGWTVIQDTQELSYLHWYSFYDEKGAATLSGLRSAYVDTKIYDTPEDHKEPAKHEWLISPEITLPSDKAAQLSFLWQAHKIQALDEKTYNTWVLVSTNDGATWDTIWSLTNPITMINSGVEFPWKNFGKYKSELDLSKYKGKKIKLAWYYHNFEFGKGDMFKLDNISVVKYDAIFTPVAAIDPSSFSFTNAYIGVPISSGNVFSLTNTGIDTLRIVAVEGLDGTDFKCMIGDFSKIELKKNETLKFSIQYTPTTEGAKNATLTIKTNGGDVKISLAGNKIVLPANYTFESFESGKFPPVGWTANNWKLLNIGSSGYYSATPSFSNKAILKSPRLDLTGVSSPYINFDFIDYADDDATGSYCDNENTIEISTDGGNTWEKIFTTTASAKQFWTRQKINLTKITPSDNCYIRFVFNIDGELSFDNIISEWYLDNIVLPPLYGRNLPPAATSKPIPANNAKNQFINALKLSWEEVLHATSYQVKVGSSKENLGEIVDTTLTGNQLIINNLLNSTNYYWSVTPKNAAGASANTEIWMFSTVENLSISEFPYLQGFEEESYPPIGWRTETLNENGPKWGRSNNSPYDGKYSAYCEAHEGESYLTMPALKLPTDKEIQIAFIWGNDVPVSLSRTTSAPENAGEKYINADTIFFEVSTDEIKWKQFAFLSEIKRDTAYWRRQKVVLSEYAGKTVYVRWRYHSVNYAKSKGASLDNIAIEEYMKNGKAVFNQLGWNAGVVNHKNSVDSKNLLTILNDGDDALVVESVTFKSANFSSNIQNGASIAKNAILPFTITFVANPVGEIKDTMTIVFANGLIAKFPVEGNALPINTRCYTFDQEDAFTTSITDFTMLDVDGKSTCEPLLIYYPKRGTPLPFIVMNVKAADWRNVYPTSGVQCLAALSANDGASSVEDWIISTKIMASENSKIRFYAKSYGSPDIFTEHKISILISETDDAKNSFNVLKSAENMTVPYNKEDKFTEFNIDLSQYQGKNIHVAIRHTVDKDGFVMFLDDLWFENFQFTTTDNQAPKFTTIPPAGTNLNEAFTYNFKAIDPDGDKISFTTVGLPSWVNVSYNGTDGGTLTGTPTIPGNVFFKIIASDGSATTTQEVLFAVNKSNNQAPTFTTTPPTTAQVGVDFTYEFKATDLEGDALRFSVTDLPSWLNATYNRVDGGTLTGTPTEAGSVSFKIKVTDGQLETIQNINLEIQKVSNNPENEISFKCYPNPVRSSLTIETTETNYEITLINLAGTEIYKAQNVKTISLKNYPNGLYFVRFGSKNNVKVLRIIKQ